MIPIKLPNAAAFEQLHQKVILSYMADPMKKTGLAKLNAWLKKNNIHKGTFAEVLIAKPKDLIRIADQLDQIKWKVPSEVENLKKLYEKFSVVKKTPFRIGNNRYSGYTFVSMTGVTVCPYCNRNYVLNVPGENNRTSELDHSFNKDTYPLLSLSLYNLVPVCKPCNHIKSNKRGRYYNPYNSSIKIFPKFRVEIKAPMLFNDLDSFDLRMSVPKDFKDNINNLFIDKLYSLHKDLVLDIIRRKYVYNDTWIKDIFNQLKDLNLPYGKVLKNEDELLNLLLGVFIDSVDFHKRPFSKLVSDVWAQIKKDKRI
ncbi:hypothetical protein ACTJJB_23725 [Chitinophaga sp. 22536]|uniref:hypothetical protein n=1 Tax=unclassified Chitinophaga TaxID=2619133 RepID=UPI003F82449E